MPDRAPGAPSARRPIRSLATPAGAVAAFVALGALLRFAGLGAKSFWRDEAFTVRMARSDLPSALDLMVNTEATPPLYYLLVWPWCQVLGSSEAGIRSLSALFGVATIVVAWLVGRELVSARVGVAAAGLVAVNPVLVWYSQEARAYALLVLLGGLGFLFFVRVLRSARGRPLLGWTIVSALTICTHWFALFLVAVQAPWLLAASRLRRRVVVACAALAVFVVALLPLLLEQRGDGMQHDWIGERPLLARVVQLPAVLLVGFETPAPVVAAAVAGALAAVCLWPLLRRENRLERRGAGLALAIGGASVALPVVLALAVHDYFYYRNVLGSVVPLALVLAAGAGAAHAGRAARGAAALLGALSVAIVLVTIGEPKYHREDWRAATAALGTPDVDRAVVMTPAYSRVPLLPYMPRTERMRAPAAPVREVVALALPGEDAGALARSTAPRARGGAPADGFRLVEQREEELFTLLRYRAPRPVRIGASALARSAIGGGEATVLFQPAEGGRGAGSQVG